MPKTTRPRPPKTETTWLKPRQTCGVFTEAKQLGGRLR